MDKQPACGTVSIHGYFVGVLLHLVERHGVGMQFHYDLLRFDQNNALITFRHVPN